MIEKMCLWIIIRNRMLFFPLLKVYKYWAWKWSIHVFLKKPPWAVMIRRTLNVFLWSRKNCHIKRKEKEMKIDFLPKANLKFSKSKHRQRKKTQIFTLNKHNYNNSNLKFLIFFGFLYFFLLLFPIIPVLEAFTSRFSLDLLLLWKEHNDWQLPEFLFLFFS